MCLTEHKYMIKKWKQNLVYVGNSWFFVSGIFDIPLHTLFLQNKLSMVVIQPLIVKTYYSASQ
jgi:hypothetical protein